MQLCHRTSSFQVSTPRRGVQSMLLYGTRVLPSATCPVDALPSDTGRSLRAITVPVPSGCEKQVGPMTADAAGAACTYKQRRRRGENGDQAPRGVIGRFARYRPNPMKGS